MSENNVKKIETSENENILMVTLKEVLDICSKYGLSEISQKELQDWFVENIKVYTYLPIQTKFLLINQILYNEPFYSVDDSSLKAMEFEMKKFWVIALAYTNIDLKGYEDLQTISSYDLLFSIMGNWLLTIIEKDYDRTIEILNQTVNINNINSLMETFGSMDTKSLRRYTTEIVKQLKYFEENKEAIKDLATIARFNQPSLDDKLNNDN